MTDDKRAQEVAVVADEVLRLIASRAGMEPHQLIDLIRWQEEHRGKLKKASWGLILAMLGTFAWGFAATLIEGIRAVFRVKGG